MMQEHKIFLGQDDGEDMSLEGTDHVALYARSGSGKTSSFVIPNCFLWPGSLVVLDLKGDCFAATAGYRSAKLCQDIYRFDPESKENMTHRWSPLDAIERTSDERFDQIYRLAFILFPESTESSASGSSSASFWTPSARDAFIAVLGLIAETPAMPMTMSHVLRLFSSEDSFGLFIRLIERAREEGHPYSQDVVSGIADYLSGPMEQVQGIRKMVTTAIGSFRSPRTNLVTSISDFDMRELRRRPMTIYLTISPSAIPRMRPLIRMFFDQLIRLNTDVTPDKDASLIFHTLILLDEYASLGRIEATAQAAQFARQYGLRLGFVTQGKAQIRHIYGNYTAEDIFGNVGAEIAYATSDVALAKEMETRLGTNTEVAETINRPRVLPFFKPDKQTESESKAPRPLMLAQEIMQLDPDKQIIIRPGAKPKQIERLQWWRDPMLSKLALIPPPPIPQHKLDIPMDDGTTKLSLPQSRGGSGQRQESGPP